ncbi:energy transducer TonB [Dendrosporobacter sp. 1207_IL3150]|uniref:energy transducer TonB n=1 Tax=Dendrosporobacter sp. 1207_IL3150 TaxID=3084054 RepID=UPI002FD88F4A
MLSFKGKWRKAIVFSLIFHLFAVIIISSLATQLFAAPPVIEQYIELDLSPTPSNNASTPTETSHTSENFQPQQQIIPDSQTASLTPAVTTSDVIPLVSALPPVNSGSRDVINTSAPVSSGSATNTATGSGSKSGGFAPPRILTKIEPDYPASARQAGMQGTVILRVEILDNGRPGDISVQRTSGNDSLDDSAIKAVQRWRFVPAKELDSGRSIVCYTSLPISFRLK